MGRRLCLQSSTHNSIHASASSWDTVHWLLGCLLPLHPPLPVSGNIPGPVNGRHALAITVTCMPQGKECDAWFVIPLPYAQWKRCIPQESFSDYPPAAHLPHLNCRTWLQHFLACIIIVFFELEIMSNLEKSCTNKANNTHLSFMQIHLLLTVNSICLIIRVWAFILSFPLLSLPLLFPFSRIQHHTHTHAHMCVVIIGTILGN